MKYEEIKDKDEIRKNEEKERKIIRKKDRTRGKIS
jgi:hypothetical protein